MLRIANLLQSAHHPRTRRLILVVSAGFAGLLIWVFLSRLEQTYQEEGESVRVLVANRYIPAGTVLRPELFQFDTLPKAYLQPNAVIHFEVLESSPGRAHYRNALSLERGTQLCQRDLMALANTDAVSQWIPDRQVAVSFSVNDARGIGGNLKPGDLIDILRTPKANELKPVYQTTTLFFQAVPIIAVGKKWIRPGQMDPAPSPTDMVLPEQDENTVLTVLLNPRAAVRLAEARENDILSVTLRAPGNDHLLEDAQ